MMHHPAQNGRISLEQESESKMNQQKDEQNEFRLHVEGLFAGYHPETALEEEAVIRIARALWMKRTQGEFNSDTRHLDQEINTALGQLYKSKVLRKHVGLPDRRGENLSARRIGSRHGLIRRPVMNKARAHPQSDILQLLAPVRAAIDPDPDLTRGNALIRKKWSDGRGHGLTSEEADELHAIKGSRVPDEMDARRRWKLADQEIRTADEEIELARLIASFPTPLDKDPWTQEQRESWAPIVRAWGEAAKGGSRPRDK